MKQYPLDTFESVIEWVKEEVLAEVKNSYDTEFKICGAMFGTMDGNEPFERVTPMPMLLEGGLDPADPEFRKNIHDLVDKYAACAIMLIVPAVTVEEESKIENSVIVSLEHKGGTQAWISKISGNAFGEFEDYSGHWPEGSKFAGLIPKKMVN